MSRIFATFATLLLTASAAAQESDAPSAATAPPTPMDLGFGAFDANPFALPRGAVVIDAAAVLRHQQTGVCHVAPMGSALQSTVIRRQGDEVLDWDITVGSAQVGATCLEREEKGRENDEGSRRAQ